MLHHMIDGAGAMMHDSDDGGAAPPSSDDGGADRYATFYLLHMTCCVLDAACLMLRA